MIECPTHGARVQAPWEHGPRPHGAMESMRPMEATGTMAHGAQRIHERCPVLKLRKWTAVQKNVRFSIDYPIRNSTFFYTAFHL